MKPTREQVLHELLVNSDYAKMADAIMALYEDKPCPKTPCPACGKVGYWTAHYHEGGELLCDCQKPPKWEEEFKTFETGVKLNCCNISTVKDFIREKLRELSYDFQYRVIGFGGSQLSPDGISRFIDTIKKWGL